MAVLSAGAWQETIHCHTDLCIASRWKPHFYDLASNHTHPFCNSPLFTELLPYFVWEETRQKHHSRRWGLLKAMLESHRHVWENARLCKTMTNTNTFLAEILRKSNCVQLSNLSCIWPRNTCGRSDWTPLSFQLAAQPWEKRAAGFTKDLQGRRAAGVLFFSFLATPWNLYHHMLEKCHQDERLLLINKSQLRNNWNPMKNSSNMKTKGTIC